jgi:hypothetical protein
MIPLYPRQGDSGQDQGNAPEHRRSDVLAEHQDAEHDGDHGSREVTVEATVAPSLVMIW